MSAYIIYIYVNIVCVYLYNIYVSILSHMIYSHRPTQKCKESLRLGRCMRSVRYHRRPPWVKLGCTKHTRCKGGNLGKYRGNKNMLSGWWYTYPSEKYEFVSWDDDIPKIWKVIKFHGSKPPTSYGSSPLWLSSIMGWSNPENWGPKATETAQTRNKWPGEHENSSIAG